jgi:glycosyltransferase involved in cell wall biosynthesis
METGQQLNIEPQGYKPAVKTLSAKADGEACAGDVPSPSGPLPPPPLPVVLQVLPGLVTGGAERGCIDVAVALANAGARTLVASSGGPMTRELDRVGIEHITLPLASKNPWVIYRNAARLEALIRRHRVTIVHARSRAPAWSAWMAAQRTGARFITTFHAPYNFSSRLKFLYNAVMAKGERIIAISSFIRDHILTHYPAAPEQVRLVHRGIDPAIFGPDRVNQPRMIQLAKQWRLPDDRLVILLPGRLTRWKGQLDLIDAVAKLGRRDVCCVLVGGDQGRHRYRSELERRIAHHDLGGIVHIVDHCSDMAAAYMLATVVVSASREPEAFGRVIVEAQAMGRPVIVTDIGAVLETVIPGVTALVVPPADPEAMARALDQALNMTLEERATQAKQAMAHVAAHFSKDQMCRQTLEIYRELAASPRPAVIPP